MTAVCAILVVLVSHTPVAGEAGAKPPSDPAESTEMRGVGRGLKIADLDLPTLIIAHSGAAAFTAGVFAVAAAAVVVTASPGYPSTRLHYAARVGFIGSAPIAASVFSLGILAGLELAFVDVWSAAAVAGFGLGAGLGCGAISLGVLSLGLAAYPLASPARDAGDIFQPIVNASYLAGILVFAPMPIYVAAAALWGALFARAGFVEKIRTLPLPSHNRE